MTTNSTKVLNENIIKFILLFILILSLISKLFYGLDIDEQYALSMGYRLYNADKLLSNIWNPYQLSSLFVYPIFVINNLFFDNFNYLILNVRLFGMLIQIIISIVIYYFFKHNISSNYAYIASFTYLIFLPKQTLIIDHSNLLNWFSTLLIIFLYSFLQNRKIIYLLLSGLCLSLSVIAYPTQAPLLFLVIFIIFFYCKKNKLQYSIILIFTCFILFISFIGILATYMSFDEIIYNTLMITKEGSHNISIINRISNETISFSFVFFLVSTLSYLFSIVFYLIQKKLNLSYLSITDFYLSNMILIWPMAIIALLLIGIIWPPLAMYRRYLIYVIVFFIIVLPNKKINKNELIFLIIPSFISLICLLSSNQGIDSACGYLSCAVAYSIMKFIEYLSAKKA